VTGQLVYLSDLSLSPNQAILVYDNDTQALLDTIVTDANAAFQFNGKPNRSYTFKVKNADGIEESFALNTTDKIAPSITYAANLKGRSPKQIKDSTEKVWAAIEQKRQDSIAAVSLESKFIVYYGFDKAVLTAKEKLVLDSLYNKLQKMPSTYLIVGAFTDCIGSFKYNYTLSVNRAKYVVNYLKKKGLPANRFVSNGYSKNYTITPCTVSLNKKAQQNNRRAEIVLSTVGNTNWAKLEKERGKQFYASVVSTKTVVNKPVVLNADLATASVGATIQPKKVLSNKTKSGPSINKTLVLDQDKKALVQNEPKPVEKQTIAKPIVKEEVKLVAAPSTYVDDEISKAEILVALDSLAKLRIEQERIVEYLTKRINKKPIDVLVSSDSVMIEIYDNAVHDKDSVSIIFNNRIIVDKQELKVNKPIRFNLKVDKNKKFNEMIMVAENLVAEPPNTAVMFVTEKNGRRQQIMLSTDMLHNEVVYFIRIGKE
jgi:outer membrane protein OmpA-like peptidoglycan-associated protein